MVRDLGDELGLGHLPAVERVDPRTTRSGRLAAGDHLVGRARGADVDVIVVGTPAGRRLEHHLHRAQDRLRRVVIELVPQSWITYDGNRLDAAFSGREYDPEAKKRSHND